MPSDGGPGLSLAHDRSCEAQLAEKLTEGLAAHQLPDLAALPASARIRIAYRSLSCNSPHCRLRNSARHADGRSRLNNTIDTTRLSLMLNDLRLPAIKEIWPKFAERSDKEGWPAARFLAAIAEHEISERGRRRIERHLKEARLMPGKTLENFDFEAVPMISKAQVMALCAGDVWLDKGANLILFGPPGGGKSHLCSAIGLALLEKGLPGSVRPYLGSGAEAAGRSPRTVS